MTKADEIAQWLADKGIVHAFGIIGGGNVALWDAIARLSKTEIVCTHHEQAAAMAACFYQRTCARMALCLVTTGGGSSNAVTGVLAGYMDRTPLLVISGNEPSRYMDAETRVWGIQGYDSSRSADKFVKQSARVGVNDDWHFKAELCRQISLEPPFGPVWIDIPADVQRAVV